MILKGNTSMQLLIATALALCGVVAATPSAAQSGPPPGVGGRPSADTVTIGLGVGVTTSYDGASDYRVIPGGALRGTVKGHDFQLNGLQLFVDAIANDTRRKIDIELGPVAGVNLNRTGDVSDARVAALGELETAVELGARGSIGLRGVMNRTDKLALVVTGKWDVAGAHRSHVITPSVEYSTMAGRRTFVRLAFTTEFVGKRYANYYFGIDGAGAAASGLAAWDPDSGLASIGGSVLANYSLSGRRTGWSVFGIASYKRLQGDIAASPIVRDTGSPDQLFSSIGLAYTF